MIKRTILHIKTEKFPILPGEKDELVNDGMYGKGLAIYLNSSLKSKGYNSPFYCCEDWGWWVHIKGFPYLMGLCIYGSVGDDGGMHEYVVCSATTEERIWSWRKFRKVDTVNEVTKLMDDVELIFKEDSEITQCNRLDDFPW